MTSFDHVFANDVSLTLKKEEALVLFEMIADVQRQARIPIRNAAERRAIWNLTALLEKTLAEPFMKDYATIIKEAQKRLVPGDSE